LLNTSSKALEQKFRFGDPWDFIIATKVYPSVVFREKRTTTRAPLGFYYNPEPGSFIQ